MKSVVLFRLIWLLAGCAMILGWSRESIQQWLPRPRELPRQDGGTGLPWYVGDFIPGAAYPSTAPGLLPSHIQNVGSWVTGEDWRGRAETAWFRPSRRVVHVGVAGYPRTPGCRLWAEFRLRDDRITRVPCTIPSPREQWNVWSFPRPPDAVAVRIVGEDEATGSEAWLAFSHPFRARQVFPAWYALAQLISTGALALTLIWGPGLLAQTRLNPGALASAVVLGTGPLLLALLGVVIWCASGDVPPGVLGTITTAILWLAIGNKAWRPRSAWNLPAGLSHVLALSVLVTVGVVAKSSYSRGPEGELFRGTISRNFTLGDRIDSRYPFYITQAVAGNLGPASPKLEGFFYPWTFFSRGPLAGLATVPIVFATGGHPPPGAPDQRWSPYDPFGFAAYRVTMIALASEIIVALFLLLQPLCGEAWALIGAGLLALSPFGVHEIMFTWPKWAGTAGVLCSFMLLHERRPFAGGIALAIGHLFHPLALMWAPWLGLWACARSERRWQPIALTALKFGGAATLIVAPWLLAGQLAPHLPTTPFAGQVGFLDYFQQADRAPATWATWWHTRWMNFANTFIPAHFYLSDSSFNHFRANSTDGPSGKLVKFALVWWTSLPFGLGLGLWLVSLGALASAWRNLRQPIIVFLVGPALLMTSYWGWDPLGMMRECGHPLFVAVIGLTCIAAAQHASLATRLLTHPLAPWLQLPETWLMLWLTTLLNPGRWPVEFNQLDSAYLVLNAAALMAAAWLLQRARQRIAHGTTLDYPGRPAR